jgi:hypothetical protein
MVPILSGMNEAAVGILSREAMPEAARSGEAMAREVEPGRQLFVIKSGSVRVDEIPAACH